ncbi:MAG: MoxR family ATPase [Planctomycetaceae bacterium]|nr:MoxR family ATPase [Planctomycetaceae bacterium]
MLDRLFVALLADGHILFEGLPGLAKTLAVNSLAKVIQCDFKRIQFTPDLLPADLIGTNVYNPKEGTFSVNKGPIFTNILLADEINRASPRTQSALLEAMSEGQATIEGVQYELPKPFLVLATQNPVDFHGTYPLPEAQLDRFLVRLELGYPNPDMEMAMLFDQAVSLPVDSVPVTMSTAELSQMQQDVRLVLVDESVAKYMLDIVARTRGHSMLKLGVSPRGSLMLFRAAQASAFVQGRRFVLPDDVQRVAPYVLSHRLVLTSKARYGAVAKHDVVYGILGEIPVPA